MFVPVKRVQLIRQDMAEREDCLAKRDSPPAGHCPWGVEPLSRDTIAASRSRPRIVEANC